MISYYMLCIIYKLHGHLQEHDDREATERNIVSCTPVTSYIIILYNCIYYKYNLRLT